MVPFLVVPAVLLAACGGSDEKMRAVPPPSTTSPVVSSPVQSGPPSDTGRPQLIVPSNDAVDVHPMRFDVHEVRAVAGGVLVRFWAGIAPCFALDHYAVTETPERVTIGLFAGRARGNQKTACAAIALRYEVKVPLHAPLGAREVVDANAR
jgi:hypothetical protein